MPIHTLKNIPKDCVHWPCPMLNVRNDPVAMASLSDGLVEVRVEVPTLRSIAIKMTCDSFYFKSTSYIGIPKQQRQTTWAAKKYLTLGYLLENDPSPGENAQPRAWPTDTEAFME